MGNRWGWAAKGVKGVAARVPMGQALEEGWGWGRDFPRPLSCRAPSSLPERSPFPGAEPSWGMQGARGRAGMREDALRCRRGPGALGGLVTEDATPGAGWSLPPALRVTAHLPQPRPPQSVRCRPQEPGVGSLSAPLTHRLSSGLPSSARALAPPPPGLPPEWEGAAVPPPRPFPPRP